MEISDIQVAKHPSWIRQRVSWGVHSEEVKNVLKELKLNSVCISAACPNRGECWDKKQVTFMILGKNCTRACKFCNIHKESTETVDLLEPERIAQAIKKLGIRYVVITSVTRDDLPDQGADQFVRTVRAIKDKTPETAVELLIPDMGADEKLLKDIVDAGADVIGHNIEIPKSLYKTVRPGTGYERSLKVLETLKKNCSKTPIKSSMIIGLGEAKSEISDTMKDLHDTGVDIIYVGQYLSPTKEHWPVKKYYTPEEFRLIEKEAEELGFSVVCSAPMVRSSYMAERAYLQAINEGRNSRE